MLDRDVLFRRMVTKEMMGKLPPSAQQRFDQMFTEAANFADSHWGKDEEFTELMKTVSSLFFIIGYREGRGSDGNEGTDELETV